MRPLAAFVLALALAACIDITVDSNAIGSIEFAPLPYPSVDAGDTLRTEGDSSRPLPVNVYTADGTRVPDPHVTFLTLETSITISSDGYLIAKPLKSGAKADTARIFASVGSLQSLMRQVIIVPRPETTFTEAPARDTILYSLPAAASDTSTALTVRINGRDGSGAAAGVSHYLVRYRLENFAGQVVTANDTTLAFFLIDNGGKVTSVDTTDASGIASRRLRFRIRQGQAAIDSMKVLAEVRRGNRIVKGSPFTWVVLVRPKS